MTQHQILKHDECTVPNCAICTGTVKLCLICMGANTEIGGNALTTDCCLKPLKEEQKIAIAAKNLDYKSGRWHDKRLGPTIKNALKDKGKAIKVGDLFKHLNPEEGDYICVGVYDNSSEQTMYAFHQVMTVKNRIDVGFISIIHYAKFIEKFGEI